MGPSQAMYPGAGTRRSSAGTVPVGNATSEKAIPIWTAGFLLFAVAGLYTLDKAKFKMVVGVT